MEPGRWSRAELRLLLRFVEMRDLAFEIREYPRAFALRVFREFAVGYGRRSAQECLRKYGRLCDDFEAGMGRLQAPPPLGRGGGDPYGLMGQHWSRRPVPPAHLDTDSSSFSEEDSEEGDVAIAVTEAAVAVPNQEEERGLGSVAGAAVDPDVAVPGPSQALPQEFICAVLEERLQALEESAHHSLEDLDRRISSLEEQMSAPSK